MMSSHAHTRSVVVIGAGAAGALTAARLLRRADQLSLGLVVRLVGAGAAVGDTAAAPADPSAVLSAPAGAMSAYAEDPDHFVRWRAERESCTDGPRSFAPLDQYDRYLAFVLDEAVHRARGAVLHRLRDRVDAVRPRGGGLALRLRSGRVLHADAAVLALGGLAPSLGWAPASLLRSPHLIRDPWSPGALDAVPSDAEVLLAGAGPTMVDVALRLDRPGRVLHAISLPRRLPRSADAARLAAVRLPSARQTVDLATLRRLVVRQLADGEQNHREPLWHRLPLDDRSAFSRQDPRLWESHRHRLPPQPAAPAGASPGGGRLEIGVAEVTGTRNVGDALQVHLSDGRRLSVGAVVACTGACADTRASTDPLVRDLIDSGTARPGPDGLGFDTAGDGRLPASGGEPAPPLWTLGAPRGGARPGGAAVPELRVQADEVARAVVRLLGRHRPSRSRSSDRRPRDPYGLPLTTTAEAADLYNEGLRRFLGVQAGAEELIRKSVHADPGFAVGHAALALLGDAGAADTDVQAALNAARGAARARLDPRERSFVLAVAEQVCGRDESAPPDATHRLLRHIRAYPHDALCVNIAVPTISSNGVTQGSQTWALIESLASSYGNDPWYLGQLAFVRQEQSRWDEADTLACRALDADPASGHAVHARAHVFYETGEHRDGLDWLGGWLRRHGPGALHTAHFSWHAALHELMLDDPGAVRRRYDSQLAPPLITGSRAVVDSGSLLWRCHVTDRWDGSLPVADILEAAPKEWLGAPPTAFAAMHVALALAAAADTDGLHRLRRTVLRSDRPELPRTLAGLCDGLTAVVEHRWDRAAGVLLPLLPRLEPLGGSAAQREVVEETLLHALIRAGRNDEAAQLLSSRLDRRPAPLDLHRFEDLTKSCAGGTPWP
jgi:uncharacterized NAD(P)/FAD-binding protein YdhS